MPTNLGHRSSIVLFGLGAAAIIFGVIVCFWPGLTMITFAIIWGIYALIDGFSTLAAAFSRETGGRGWLIFAAVISLIAGFVAVFRPGLSVAALTWVLGVWMVVRGAMEIVSAFSQRTTGGKALLVLGGVLWIIAGAVVMVTPVAAAITFGVWLGILAIAWGVALVGAGFATRGAAKI